MWGGGWCPSFSIRRVERGAANRRSGGSMARGYFISQRAEHVMSLLGVVGSGCGCNEGLLIGSRLTHGGQKHIPLNACLLSVIRHHLSTSGCYLLTRASPQEELEGLLHDGGASGTGVLSESESPQLTTEPRVQFVLV